MTVGMNDEDKKIFDKVGEMQMGESEGKIPQMTDEEADEAYNLLVKEWVITGHEKVEDEIQPVFNKRSAARVREKLAKKLIEEYEEQKNKAPLLVRGLRAKEYEENLDKTPTIVYLRKLTRNVTNLPDFSIDVIFDKKGKGKDINYQKTADARCIGWMRDHLLRDGGEEQIHNIAQAYDIVENRDEVQQKLMRSAEKKQLK